MPVRVRFAPSPTGHLHVGNVRTALYNWLFARQRGGTFILRIEDTDAERSERRFEEQLMDDLRWLGLDWDEGVEAGGEYGPYRQTERFGLYQQHADRLLEEGKAYFCFCSVEELERERERQLSLQQQPHYSGKCRAVPPAEARRRVEAGEEATLRLLVRDGTVGFDDLVFGRVEVDCSVIGDFILLRSDRSAQYNFACVIDDAGMQITHVIRGEGHISNTHRQVLLYEALGLPLPVFAHLSTILGSDGSKLSKRHGATSIDEFRRQGYLPTALVNYLALLGWAPQEGAEILPVPDLVRSFDLERVNRSPATFDIEKLNWVNRSHLKQVPPDRLANLAVPFLRECGLLPDDPSPEVIAWTGDVAGCVLNHLEKLDQLPQEAAIVFSFSPEEDLQRPEVQEALGEPGARQVIAAFARLVAGASPLDYEAYKQIVMTVKQETGQKGKNLFHPIRVAITGRSSGPELDKLIPVLERGCKLALPVRVLGVRERVQRVQELLG